MVCGKLAVANSLEKLRAIRTTLLHCISIFASVKLIVDKNASAPVSKPGPIENMPLVDTDAKETGDIVVTKQGLKDGFDFELIPLEAWHILYAWWASNLICIGLHFRYNGGPAIKRKVVKASSLMNNSLSVEVRLLALNCVKSSDQLPVSIGYFSKCTTVGVFKV